MSSVTPVTASMAGYCLMVSTPPLDMTVRSWICNTSVMWTFCIKKLDDWPTNGHTADLTFLVWIWIWWQTPSYEHQPLHGSHSTRQWQNSCYILTPLSKAFTAEKVQVHRCTEGDVRFRRRGRLCSLSGSCSSHCVEPYSDFLQSFAAKVQLKEHFWKKPGAL